MRVQRPPLAPAGPQNAGAGGIWPDRADCCPQTDHDPPTAAATAAVVTAGARVYTDPEPPIPRAAGCLGARPAAPAARALRSSSTGATILCAPCRPIGSTVGLFLADQSVSFTSVHFSSFLGDDAQRLRGAERLVGPAVTHFMSFFLLDQLADLPFISFIQCFFFTGLDCYLPFFIVF